MDKEIMDLVHKRRKELGLEIRKKKVPKPEGYFIVKEKGRLSEIRVPGVEWYFDDSTGNRKAQLAGFLENKWRQYRSRNQEMILVSVMLISDLWYAPDDGITPAASKHPKRKEALGFFLHSKNERKAIMFLYERKGKHIIFSEVAMDQEDYEGARMNNLFPNI